MSPLRSSDRHTDAESVLSPTSYNNHNMTTFKREASINSPSRLPRRIFQWLYSISLLIFVLHTAGFVLVTPIDIIVQTWGSPSTALKTLIVIGACAIFFIISLVIYFLRLYQSRVALNQIPSKSVYIPLEKNDLPKDVIQYIDEKLRYCISDVRARASPLQTQSKINYPGMSPPEYIQKRNRELGYPNEGTLFPPTCIYEDIIDSLGLKLRLDGLLVTNLNIPENYSFREIVMAMTRMLLEEQSLDPALLPNIQSMIILYEKFKFSPEPIHEDEMAKFLVSFEKLSTLYNLNRGTLSQDDTSVSTKHSQLDNPYHFLVARSHHATENFLSLPWNSNHGRNASASGSNSFFNSGTNSGTGSGIRIVGESTEESPTSYYPRNRATRLEYFESPQQYYPELEARKLLSRHSGSSQGSFHRYRSNSEKSTGSVIRNRLAFGRRLDTGSRGVFEGDTIFNNRSGSESEGASHRRNSGYVSDTEDDRRSQV